MFRDGLYPTVAISDAFNAAGNVFSFMPQLLMLLVRAYLCCSFGLESGKFFGIGGLYDCSNCGSCWRYAGVVMEATELFMIYSVEIWRK